MRLKHIAEISTAIASFISYTYYVYNHDFMGVMCTFAFYIVINLIINLIAKDEDTRD